MSKWAHLAEKWALEFRQLR